MAEKCYSFRKLCEKADREWHKLVQEQNSFEIVASDECKIVQQCPIETVNEIVEVKIEEKVFEETIDR